MNDIYKEIVNNSSMSYIHINTISDNQGRYKSLLIKNVNKSFEMMFNIKKENILNREFREQGINGDKRIECLVVKAIKEKKLATTKYVKEVDDYLNLEMYAEDEENIHIIITKIGKQNMKLSHTIKSSPFLAWIKDKNGVYVDVNKSYIDFIGREYNEIIGKTDFDLWKYEHAIKCRQQDDEVIRTEKLLIDSEDNAVSIDNKRLYLESSKWPYYDEESKVILGTIGVGKQIENILELRKSIEENEKTFQEIANNLNEVLIIIDKEKALYVSQSFERVYKVSPKELKIYDDINNWYKYWDEIEFITEPGNFYDRFVDNNIFRVRKNGEDIWIWSRFAPIYDENGNIVKKIGILSDITESKKNESEMENIKVDFFANLSHELRTPINLINSCIQVLDLKIDDLKKENYDYFKKYINIINQNNMRLLKLVNNLIDTTKINSGNFDYSPKNQDIIACVENICMSVSSFAEYNNLKLIFDTNIEEKIISFDEDNMERIVLNLLSNAIKFSEGNKSIYVNIDFDKDIKIIVKDEGVGIPKENLDTIFGRFEQVKSKFKMESEGSGIGLSLVKSLVEMNKGSIKVNSELGKGSEFIITLPDVLGDEEITDNASAYKYHFNVKQMMIEFSDIYK